MNTRDRVRLEASGALFDKYEVARKDGTPVEGWFFVLRPAKDPAARTALLAYADAVDPTNHVLARELRAVVNAFTEEA